MILALTGGVGGAKLVFGFSRLLAPADLISAVNTGDDFSHLGLHISPDIDTLMYTLAGLANPVTGWGRADESWHFMDTLQELGGENWFRLGDRDLATNVLRTHLLASGRSLSEVTATLCSRLGVRHAILPMSDDPVRTMVETDEGQLAFQDYFVRRQCQPTVHAIHFEGAQTARLPAALMAAFDSPRLQSIIISPSNPYLSIGPLLAMPELRARLKAARVPVIAVSPIVGGQAIKGPTAKIMQEMGHPVSALQVAQEYGPLLDGFVIDTTDADAVAALSAQGIRPFITDIVMRNDEDRVRLAAEVLQFSDSLQK